MSTNSLQVQAQLRNEVLVLQGTIRDLHSQLKITPDKVAVPSWRYPEKTASDVSISVKDIEDDHLLLELLVDRLTFLLQSCVLEIEAINKPYSKQSHKTSSSNSLPLSLSSTVKRFVRGFVQLAKKFKEIESNVDSMNGDILQLQRELSFYHDIITNQMGADAMESINPPTTRGEAVTLTAAGACDTRTVSTQTTQTSLAAPPVTKYNNEACSKCPKHVEQLVKMTKRVSNLRFELVQQKQCQQSEREAADVKAVMETDLAAIKDCFSRYEKENKCLKKQLTHKELIIPQLEEQYSQVLGNVSQLEEQLKENQKKYEQTMSEYRKTHDTQLNEVKNELSQVLNESATLRHEVTSLKSLEGQLRSVITEKNDKVSKLELSLESSQRESSELKVAKEKLSKEIVSLKREHNEVCLELEERSLQLNKTSTQLANIESRCKYLQSKQTKLLNQIDELDQNCSHLNEMLNETAKERESAKEKLAEMTEKCAMTLTSLEKEKMLLEKSNQENQSLKIECQQLHEDAKLKWEELKEEKNKARLLMEYPFSSRIKKILSLSESREHIDANSVRILLLEEQNKEIRELHTPREDSNLYPLHFQKPVTLWKTTPNSHSHPKQFETANKTVACSNSRVRSFCSPPPPPPPSLTGLAVPEVRDLESGGSLGSLADPYTGLETHSCNKCDYTFTPAIDLTKHCCDCNNK